MASFGNTNRAWGAAGDLRGPSSPPIPAGGAGAAGHDMILVPRAALSQLQAHLAAEYDRFPARRLRQAMQIVKHLLGEGAGRVR